VKEKGVLIVGSLLDGRDIGLEFRLRPQLVSDSIIILESEDSERCIQNNAYYGLCLLARQIESLGNLPKEEITPGLLMSMYEVDLAEISAASERLKQRLISFRGKDEASKGTDAGTEKDGVHSGGDPADAGEPG
jgi:phage FluMu protein gp41